MKTRMEKKSILITVLAVVLVLIGLVVLGQVRANAAKDEFEVEVEIGFEGEAERGTYTPVTVKTHNKGKDFTGTIQVIAQENYGNVMYEKEVSIPAGATKEVSLTIPLIQSNGSVRVRVVNHKGKVRWTDKVKYSTVRNITKVKVGVLSDDYAAVGYMDGIPFPQYTNGKVETKIYEMTENNIPNDWRALSMLDVLVITNYSSDKLTDEQVTAIQYWVKNGGLLIVSTGSTASKTLAGLNGKIVNVTPGNLSTATSKLGLDKETFDFVYDNFNSYYYWNYDNNVTNPDEEQDDKEDYWTNDPEDYMQFVYDELKADEINYLSYTLEDPASDRVTIFAGDEASKKNFPIYDYMSYGDGVISVTSVDLTQNPIPGYKGSSLFFITMLENCIGDKIEEKINNYSSNYNYSYNPLYSQRRDTLEAIEVSKTPSMLLYGFLLLAYVIAIPIVYVVVKKKKSGRAVWIALPVLSAFFGLIIFLASFTTRILSPELNIATEWAENTKGRIDETKMVSALASSNKGLDIGFDPEYSTGLMEDGYYNYISNEDTALNSYTMGIRSSADEYRINIVKTSSLGTTHLTSERAFSVENSVDIDAYYINSVLTGTVTNNLGCDLESACFEINGAMYLIGKIKNGETVSLDNAEHVNKRNNGAYSTYGYSYYGNYLNNEAIEKIVPARDNQLITILFGTHGKNYKTDFARRALIEYEYDVHKNNSISDGTFMAFPSKSEYQKSAQSTTKVKEFETIIYTKSTRVRNSANGMVYTLFNCNNAIVVSDDSTIGYSQYWITDGGMSIEFYDYSNPISDAVIMYQFPTEIEGISFDLFANGGYRYFEGDISLFNNTTGTWDTVISDTNLNYTSISLYNCEILLDELKPYLQDDVIYVKYSTSYPETDWQIPALYYLEKEE